MNLKNLFGEDRAVSPVIGVILMVAITVILAAVIGTFVLGLGDKVSTTTPQANFQFDYTQGDVNTNDTLEVAHSGGDSIPGSQLNASVNGAIEKNGSSTALTFSGDLFDSKVSAGSSQTLDGGDFSGYAGAPTSRLDLSGATVRVVWTAESGDSSAVLGKWSGPDA